MPPGDFARHFHLHRLPSLVILADFTYFLKLVSSPFSAVSPDPPTLLYNPQHLG